MNPKEAYKYWAEQYDSAPNKTRDLEAIALRETLQNVAFKNCIEVGCGTGKNTAWLASKAENIMAIDLSEEMLSKAASKINSAKVEFIQSDINKEWTFATYKVDLIGFSLILEHIEDLEPIFKKVSGKIKNNGFVYIGELHPFKQYTGSKAKFETKIGQQTVNCYTHHISEFTQLAEKYNFDIIKVKEFFDNKNSNNIPRILTLLFKKNTKTAK